jgi:hypothetical protein
METQIDAAIAGGIARVGGLPQYVAKMAGDADAALNLPQSTPQQVDHKIQMIVGTATFINRLIGKPELTEEQKTTLGGKLQALLAAVGRKSSTGPSAAAAGGKRRKMSRKYCKKTLCRKMGFSQQASCRPYKNCFTRRRKN